MCVYQAMKNDFNVVCIVATECVHCELGIYVCFVRSEDEHANQQLTNCAVDKCSQPLNHMQTHKMMFRHIYKSGQVVQWQMAAFDCCFCTILSLCVHASLSSEAEQLD